MSTIYINKFKGNKCPICRMPVDIEDDGNQGGGGMKYIILIYYPTCVCLLSTGGIQGIPRSFFSPPNTFQNTSHTYQSSSSSCTDTFRSTNTDNNVQR